MRRSRLLLAAVVVPVFGACSSDVVDAVTGKLTEKIETLDECFPPTMEKMVSVFEMADPWTFGGGPSVNPPGVTSVVMGEGQMLRVTYDQGGYEIRMDITFHDFDGNSQTLTIPDASVWTQLDAAATQLNERFTQTVEPPFMLGVWSIGSTGNVITGSGSFAGVIGSNGTDNILLGVSTTSSDTSGGVPPQAPGTVSVLTTVDDELRSCGLSFSTAGLTLPSSGGPDYPSGSMQITVSGKAVVSGTITFDGTNIAIINGIDGVPGYFRWDLDNDEDPIEYIL